VSSQHGPPTGSAQGDAHTTHHRPRGAGDERWLFAACAVIVVFMAAEVVVGVLAHSLALIADAGHMLTDAIGIGFALVVARVMRRPPKGAFTFGFARADALSGQANGITLVLLAIWFAVEAIRRLITPAPAHGGAMTVVALIGVAVNAVATILVSRADRSTLNVRGIFAHLLSDIWAFAATALAGIVIIIGGWYRADPVASLVVAAVMTWTGVHLIRDAGRIFLEAAPEGVDPHVLGEELTAVDGVSELHDLHVWEIRTGEPALSAHVLVKGDFDCHEVSARMRAHLAAAYDITHVTLQTDHADADHEHSAEACVDSHGEVHVSRA
jgi:cobalt-zinc-cadmium efflux system protein